MGAGLAIGAVTWLCRYLDVNATTAGFAYLITVLFIATSWSLVEAIVASVVGVLCFNFFFLPPVGTFTIADPQNWVAMVAFLAAALVGGELSARARRHARAAIRRQLELERLYALGRAILLDAGDRPVAPRLARRVAEAFELQAVTLYDVGTGREHMGGPEDLPIPPEVVKTALAGEAPARSAGPNLRFSVVQLGGKPAGVLALRGAVSDTAADAISGLVAIGLERAHIQEVENRAEAARQSGELKSTLLDAIAHEFKTPLTSIKAAVTTILADGSGVDQHQELLHIVDEETDRMVNLVSDAIQMSRIEGGKFKLRCSTVLPRELIHTVMAQMRPRLEERRLETSIAEGLSPVHVDRDLIQLSLRQLVDNALKYAPAGASIQLGADAAGGHISFWVADNGPGIPRAERERVFEKYYRGRSNRHALPGSGIGLSVVREIARAHGGDASVASEPGEGSRFTITLPLTKEISNDRSQNSGRR